MFYVLLHTVLPYKALYLCQVGFWLKLQWVEHVVSLLRSKSHRRPRILFGKCCTHALYSKVF